MYLDLSNAEIDSLVFSFKTGKTTVVLSANTGQEEEKSVTITPNKGQVKELAHLLESQEN